LQKLTGIVQANAILGTNIPQNTETTEQVLAAIINPPAPQGNKK
jgi:hypothetical protein